MNRRITNEQREAIVRRAIAERDALAATPSLAPAEQRCLMCGGSGWLGGPSFYNPGEGGEPCPECAPAAVSDISEIRGAVARGWCHPKNSAKEMDVDLAEAIAQEVVTLLAAQPAAASAAGAMAALNDLYMALRNRHHGRMPDDVCIAYEAAAKVLAGRPLDCKCGGAYVCRACSAQPAVAPSDSAKPATPCVIRYVGGWNGHAPTSTWKCETCGYKGDHDAHPGCRRPKETALAATPTPDSKGAAEPSDAEMEQIADAIWGAQKKRLPMSAAIAFARAVLALAAPAVQADRASSVTWPSRNPEPVAEVIDNDICSDHAGRVEAFQFLPAGTKLYATPEPAAQSADAVDAPSIQDVMFEVFEYAKISDGFDSATGTQRQRRREAMFQQDRKIRDMLAALSQSAAAGQEDAEAMRMLWDDQALEEKEHYRRVVREAQSPASGGAKG